jgi:hypothetical protein
MLRGRCHIHNHWIAEPARLLLRSLLMRGLMQRDLGRGHLRQRDQLLTAGAQLVGIEIAQVGNLYGRLQPLDGRAR